jgi:hypothetical protein
LFTLKRSASGRHSQYGFALKVIKIDRRFADLTFAGDQYLNSGIAFS